MKTAYLLILLGLSSPAAWAEEDVRGALGVLLNRQVVEGWGALIQTCLDPKLECKSCLEDCRANSPVAESDRNLYCNHETCGTQCADLNQYVGHLLTGDVEEATKLLNSKCPPPPLEKPVVKAIPIPVIPVNAPPLPPPPPLPPRR